MSKVAQQLLLAIPLLLFISVELLYKRMPGIDTRGLRKSILSSTLPTKSVGDTNFHLWRSVLSAFPPSFRNGPAQLKPHRHCAHEDLIGLTPSVVSMSGKAWLDHATSRAPKDLMLQDIVSLTIQRCLTSIPETHKFQVSY